MSVDAHGGPGDNAGALLRWNGIRWKNVPVPETPPLPGRCDPDGNGEWASDLVATLGTTATWTEGSYGVCDFLLRSILPGGWLSVKPPAGVQDIAVTTTGALLAVASRGIFSTIRAGGRPCCQCMVWWGSTSRSTMVGRLRIGRFFTPTDDLM